MMQKTFCSQCGHEFGPGTQGFSNCRFHSTYISGGGARWIVTRTNEAFDSGKAFYATRMKPPFDGFYAPSIQEAKKSVDRL